MSFNSFGRFLVRANMRRIKRFGRELAKSMKGEEVKKSGRRTVSNRMDNRSVVAGEKEVARVRYETPQVGRLASVESNLKEEDPPVNQHIEHEIMRGPNIAAELDEKDPREEAWSAVGQLSAVVKGIVYWTNQKEVQECLWHAIEHEEDRYVKHVLETVLAQVERTPEPEV